MLDEKIKLDDSEGQLSLHECCLSRHLGKNFLAKSSFRVWKIELCFVEFSSKVTERCWGRSYVNHQRRCGTRSNHD